MAQEIISSGKATHGQFGVSVKAKTARPSASGFSVGAEVATVEPGSAADKAGIKVGDVVTKFQDLAISDPNQLTAAVREQAAGATVKVTVLRNGQEQHARRDARRGSRAVDTANRAAQLPRRTEAGRHQQVPARPSCVPPATCLLTQALTRAALGAPLYG